MDFSINQDEVVKKITEEILKEIEGSNSTFTNEEVKAKIDAKIDEFFKIYPSNQDIKNQDITAETNWAGQSATASDKFDALLESIENEQGNSDDKNIALSTNVKEDKKDAEKNFIEEFAILYKDELQSSMDSFKNAYESIKLMWKTSAIEKILIILFLIVPAICGGLFTLFFILILLILWQIHVLLKVFTKFFDKVETSLAATITKIKNKITNLKGSGNLFNRLIFSNSLYSLIMFNGILYMLIKGMMLPLKSAAEIDKILANLMSKGVRAAAISLRGPSELALSNVRGANALRAGRTTLRENIKGRNRLQLRDLLRDRRNLRQANIAIKKKSEVVRLVDAKNRVASSIKTKLQSIQNKSTKQKTNNPEKKVETKLQTAARQNSNPSSDQQSAKPKVEENKAVMDQMRTPRININKDLGQMILGNILNALRDRIVPRGPSNTIDNQRHENTVNNRPISFGDKIRMIEDATQERVEKEGQVRDGIGKMSYAAGSRQNADRINEIYSQGGIPISEAINRSGIEMDQEAKLLFAFGKAEQNNGREDIDDAKEFLKFAEMNPDATMLEYRQHKVEDAKEDMREEEAEFAKWYGGKNCSEIFSTAMKECGYDQGATLTDEQVYGVVKHAVLDPKNGFSEDERINATKDMRKIFLKSEELKTCQSEYNEELSKTQSKHVDSLMRNRDTGRQQGGGRSY